MKIATILPYKENYTHSKAQAAAIWVCDFLNIQSFRIITLFMVIHKQQTT